MSARYSAKRSRSSEKLYLPITSRLRYCKIHSFILQAFRWLVVTCCILERRRTLTGSNTSVQIPHPRSWPRLPSDDMVSILTSPSKKINMKSYHKIVCFLVLGLLGSCADFDELVQNKNLPTSVPPALLLTGALEHMNNQN